MMNLESRIKEQAVRLKASRRNIEIAPDIQEETLNKLIKKYHSVIGEDEKDFLLVVSYTKSGSFALTGEAMYFDNYMQGGPKKILYKNIVNVSSKMGGYFSTDKVFVTLDSGEEMCLDGCIDGINVNIFSEIFSYIVEMARKYNAEFSVSKQNVALYDLSDKLKVLYLKTLCNYSYIGDQIIDAEEYGIISQFSVRMEIGSEARACLRKYMNSIGERDKTGYLLRDVKSYTASEAGQWDAFRYSLLQDILYIHYAKKPEESWTEDGFIGSLMKACSLRPAQMDTMQEAIILNRRMQEKNADLKKLKKEWKMLTDKIKYTDSYVPTLYLFCSGSIYGIKNYTGFFKKDENSQEAINKHRELILHEIIINIQKTTNILIDDMNYLVEEMFKVKDQSDELKQKYESLIQRIRIINQKMKKEEDMVEADRKEIEEAKQKIPNNEG